MKKAIGKSVGRSASSSARKSAAKKAATKGTTSKNPLVDGIQALSEVHGEAIARQSRVFESILGLGAKGPAEAAASPLAALDPFGFRKFEDVFDQRVARSLEHLGVPTLEAVAALTAEVERLRTRIATLEDAAKATKPAASSAPTAAPTYKRSKNPR